MYNKNILQDFTPKLQYIKNSKNEVIGYKLDAINTNMNLVKKEDLINFYKPFSVRMRNSNLCFFDINCHNLGFIEINKKKFVKLIDVDIVCAANILFPHIKPLPEVSSVSRYWHKMKGIEKYDTIMKSMNLNSFCSTNMYRQYNKMEKHLFIIWNDSIHHKDKIIEEISKKFQISYITKKNDILIEDSNNKKFLQDFYGELTEEGLYKDFHRKRFTSNFIIIIVNDLNPNHIMFNASQRGMIQINKNIIDCKYALRTKFGNTPPLCHASDDIDEFIHDIKAISKHATVNNISHLLNYFIKYSELYKENKINFLEYPKNISSENKKMWDNYVKYINTNVDLFAVESSFILALHNIRNASDLSYICKENYISKIDKVKNHMNTIEKNSNLTKLDIIYNPEYHFYCQGIKCLNLSTLYMIKNNRYNISHMEKDKKDCELIKEYQKKIIII